MHQMRISTNEVSSVVLEPKKLEVEKKNCEKCKEPKKKQNKSYCAMKLSQIRRRKELCMREISFVSKWIYEIYFLLDSFIHIRIFKQIPKYLATGL